MCCMFFFCKCQIPSAFMKHIIVRKLKIKKKLKSIPHIPKNNSVAASLILLHIL